LTVTHFSPRIPEQFQWAQFELTDFVAEFDNDCTYLSISDKGVDVHTPPVRHRVFTIEGLILLCMFSEQPVEYVDKREPI